MQVCPMKIFVRFLVVANDISAVEILEIFTNRIHLRNRLEYQ